jgi:hypothetical protein
MRNKIKLSLVTSIVFISSLFFPAIVSAETNEPQTVYIYDTELGTESYEALIEYGNGKHALIGQMLKDTGVASTVPGIGFGIGSGGNGYRPNVMIVIWTDETIDLDSARAAIKSFVNVPSDPVTTNGDCAIACDGTTQPEESSSSQTIVESQPEPVVESVQQTDQNVVEQPVSIQQPEQQEQAPAPQIAPDNTPQYTIPTVILESFFSYLPSTDIVAQSPISNKIINNKKIVKKNKIIIKPKTTTKKARVYATNKTKR